MKLIRLWSLNQPWEEERRAQRDAREDDECQTSNSCNISQIVITIRSNRSCKHLHSLVIIPLQHLSHKCRSVDHEGEPSNPGKEDDQANGANTTGHVPDGDPDGLHDMFDSTTCVLASSLNQDSFLDGYAARSNTQAQGERAEQDQLLELSITEEISKDLLELDCSREVSSNVSNRNHSAGPGIPELLILCRQAIDNQCSTARLNYSILAPPHSRAPISLTSIHREVKQIHCQHRHNNRHSLSLSPTIRPSPSNPLRVYSQLWYPHSI